MIGRECKYSNVFSGPILICRGLDLRSKPNLKKNSSVEVLRVQPQKQNNPVVMAKGIHLFPSRTQSLSPYTSKVLGWKRPGRIDSCRLEKRTHTLYEFFFLCVDT